MDSTLSATTTTLFTIAKTLNLRQFSTTRPSQLLPSQLALLRLRQTLNGGQSHRLTKFRSISPCSYRNLGGSVAAPPVRWCRVRCVSSSASSFASGGGGGGIGGSNTGGGGGDGAAEGGEVKASPFNWGPDDVSSLSSDVIILDVRGMTCGGCAASVKRILENEPQVLSANVNLTTETAVVWPISEAKVSPNWQKQLGVELAKHLTTCGFTSNLRGQTATEGEIPS